MNLDALYFTCFYIPEKGCAEFLDLTRPFFIPGCLGPSAALALEPRRAVARVLFEIFAEERLGREVEVIGDLLDAHARIAQQAFCLEDDVSLCTS